MGLVLMELPLALLALRRGWRVVPAVLLALPLLVLAYPPGSVALLGPLLGGYFDPAGTARALSHGLALLGLAIAACLDPAERPESAAGGARTASLYTI
jgi:hypothetical protein